MPVGGKRTWSRTLAIIKSLSVSVISAAAPFARPVRAPYPSRPDFSGGGGTGVRAAMRLESEQRPIMCPSDYVILSPIGGAVLRGTASQTGIPSAIFLFVRRDMTEGEFWLTFVHRAHHPFRDSRRIRRRTIRVSISDIIPSSVEREEFPVIKFREASASVSEHTSCSSTSPSHSPQSTFQPVCRRTPPARADGSAGPASSGLAVTSAPTASVPPTSSSGDKAPPP